MRVLGFGGGGPRQLHQQKDVVSVTGEGRYVLGLLCSYTNLQTSVT